MPSRTGGTKIIVQEFHGASANPNHPDEDYQAHRRVVYEDGREYLIAAIFDGITLGHLDPYPVPSPASEVAAVAAQTVVEAAIDPLAPEPEKYIRLLGKLSNSAVGAYNAVNGIDELTVDYKDRQYAALAGTIGLIIDGKLYAGQINDSALMVIDADGQPVYRLETDKSSVYAYYDHAITTGGYVSPSPEFFQFRWNNVINKLGVEFQGQPVRSGLLTGESVALDFWNYGSHPLRDGEIILGYTDGTIPLVEDLEFTTLIANSTDEAEINEHIKSAKIGGEHSLTVIREAL